MRPATPPRRGPGVRMPSEASRASAATSTRAALPSQGRTRHRMRPSRSTGAKGTRTGVTAVSPLMRPPSPFFSGFRAVFVIHARLGGRRPPAFGGRRRPRLAPIRPFPPPPRDAGARRFEPPRRPALAACAPGRPLVPARRWRPPTRVEGTARLAPASHRSMARRARGVPAITDESRGEHAQDPEPVVLEELPRVVFGIFEHGRTSRARERVEGILSRGGQVLSVQVAHHANAEAPGAEIEQLTAGTARWRPAARRCDPSPSAFRRTSRRSRAARSR